VAGRFRVAEEMDYFHVTPRPGSTIGKGVGSRDHA
jgi:hypothetical protein